jgi:hypothetical protein
VDDTFAESVTEPLTISGYICRCASSQTRTFWMWKPTPGGLLFLVAPLIVLSGRWGIFPILCLPRHHPPHPAPRVFRIARVARDQVDVQVRHGLAGCGAVVDADVVALGLVAARQAGAGFVQQGQQAGALLGGEVEEAAHVPARDDERVPGRHGVGVAHDQARGVAGGDALGAQVAEGAGLGLHGVSLIKIDRARRGPCGACQVKNMNRNRLTPA